MSKGYVAAALEDARHAVKASEKARYSEQEIMELRAALRAIIQAVEELNGK